MLRQRRGIALESAAKRGTGPESDDSGTATVKPKPLNGSASRFTPPMLNTERLARIKVLVKQLLAPAAPVGPS